MSKKGPIAAVRKESNSFKKSQVPDQKVRVVQDNLVFVNGIHFEIASAEKLRRDIYFGRYGKIEKLILNPQVATKKVSNYQAYVTYTSSLDAALAIVALDGFKLTQRPLKASFGTTKYCVHFLRGVQCRNNECYYLHSFEKQKQLLSTDTRSIFEERNDEAAEMLCDEVQMIATRIQESQIEQVREGFPALTQVVEYLVDSDRLTQNQVDQALKKARNKRNANFQIKQIEKQKQITQPVIYLPNPIVNKIEQKMVVNIEQQKQKKIEKQQTKAQIVVKQMNIEQKIQRSIIKQMLGGGECKSRFIKNITANRDQCSKIKAIVQRLLLAPN